MELTFKILWRDYFKWTGPDIYDDAFKYLLDKKKTCLGTKWAIVQCDKIDCFVCRDLQSWETLLCDMEIFPNSLTNYLITQFQIGYYKQKKFYC